MREGWEHKAINDVCSVVNGGTPKTGVPAYWDGMHQWVTPAEMGKRLTPYIARTERTITDAGMQNSSARLLPPLSVILSSRAPIGHLAINTVPMATNQGCKGLVPNDKLDHKFLYYYLCSIVQLLNDLGTGATFKELSGEKLKGVPIPLPSITEQHRIVAILDEAFSGIAAARANTERNLRNAREVFESYLHEVFSRGGEGWVDKTIAECFKVRSGDFLPAKEMVSIGEFDVYGGNGVNGRYDKKNVSGENIVIGRVGAKCGNVHYLESGAWITDNALYICEYFCHFDFRFLTRLLRYKDLRNRANQTAQPVISYTTIKDVLLAFPESKDEQKLIADKLDAISDKTQHLAFLYQRKLDALDELKQALLHQAFSGQL